MLTASSERPAQSLKEKEKKTAIIENTQDSSEQYGLTGASPESHVTWGGGLVELSLCGFLFKIETISVMPAGLKKWRWPRSHYL